MHIDDLEGLDDATRKEIEEFKKVTREKDGGKAYAQAQLNIGIILYDNKVIKEALSAWHKIKYSDDPSIYNFGQWNISIILTENDNIEEALIVWRNIKRVDDSKMYAQAQYNIGIALDKSNDVKEAMLVWNNIKISDDLEVYNQAQLNVGIILGEDDDNKGALSAWRNIRRTSDSRAYVKAQYNIGIALNKDYNVKGALLAWYNIKSEDDSEIYALAQYKISLSLIRDNISKKYVEAKQAFNNAKSAYPYEAYCYEKICDLLLDLKLEAIGEKALQLLNKTLKIVDILKLDFNKNFSEEKSPERKLAHYTGTYVTNLLLEVDKENNSPNSFRLNTINNVNDPSEGHLLANYLRGMRENSFYAPEFDKNLHAFISCFTFNHDSLNQFRLYGKEADKEASGVSLVFKKDFFQLDNTLGGLSFLSLDNSLKNTKKVLSYSEIDEKSNVRNESDNNIRVSKQPVMRCVYIDPTSNYIQLAQRNRITFFREFGDETFRTEDIETSKAEHEWNSYKDYIDAKTKAFSDDFINLKIIYQSIMEEKAKIDKDGSELFNDIDVLTNEILLPLKYLIKHSAFQEEQECRMVYVTSIKSPEVKMVDKKFLFVEYEAEVKENLNKVYIAPAATKYQLYLTWLLRNENVKIELSNNPYRQT